MSTSAERYWASHSAATQKPKRAAKHQRRLARKARKLAARAERRSR